MNSPLARVVTAALFVCACLSSGSAALAKDLVLNFPAESMGTLYSYPVKDRLHAAARGKVTVPAGTLLEISANYYGSNHLDQLGRLPPGTVVFASLFNLEIDDEKFSRLKNVKGLRYIATNESEVTDQGLAALADMSTLNSLWISNSRVRGRGLSLLKNLTALQELNLSSNEIDMDALANLKYFSHLKSLTLVQTGLTDTALTHLKPLSELQFLDISRNSGITDDALPRLTQLAKLKVLDISHTKITARSVKYLKQFKDLRVLTISLSNMPEADRAVFRRELPNCKLNDVTSLNRNKIPLEFFAPLH